MNVHCGKHDKIYDEELGQTCPGCDTEKQQLKGPDDTLQEFRIVEPDSDTPKKKEEDL